eukprot:Opistho-2@42490
MKSYIRHAPNTHRCHRQIKMKVHTRQARKQATTITSAVDDDGKGCNVQETVTLSHMPSLRPSHKHSKVVRSVHASSVFGLLERLEEHGGNVGSKEDLGVVGDAHIPYEFEVLRGELELVALRQLLHRVELGIRKRLVVRHVRFVFNKSHALLALLLVDFHFVLNARDGRVFLSLNNGPLALSLGLFFDDFLVLLRNHQLCLLCLHELVVAADALGDLWLRDADSLHFDAGRPFVARFLQCIHKVLVNQVKVINVNLLEAVRRAKLVQLVVDPVENERFVILDGVILDSVVYMVFLELVDNFNPLKINHDTPGSTAWYVADLVSLQGHLNALVCCDKGQHKVDPWFADCRQQRASPVIHANMPFLDTMHREVHSGCAEQEQSDKCTTDRHVFCKDDNRHEHPRTLPRCDAVYAAPPCTLR